MTTEIKDPSTTEEQLQVDYALAEGTPEMKDEGPHNRETYIKAITVLQDACKAVPRDGTPTSTKAWYAFDLFLDIVTALEEWNNGLKNEVVKMDQVIKNQNITLQKLFQLEKKKSVIVGATEEDLKKVLSETPES